jgi:hypothetical protein
MKCRILYFIYYLFGFDLYFKQFMVDSIISKDDDNYQKNKSDNKIIIFDSGVWVSRTFIPYEYISLIYFTENNVRLHVIGKLHNGSIDLNHSNNLVIEITGNNMILLKDTMLNNLYYHIKYNDIETGAMDFICPVNKTKTKNT